MTREKKWVFWSADGYYRIGDFDGYAFHPETEVLTGYDTKLGYAAQTFAGVEDRVVSMTWLRTQQDAGGFRGMMAIPTKLSLKECQDGLRLFFRPVREFRERLVKAGEEVGVNGRVAIPIASEPMVAKIDDTAGTPVVIGVDETKIHIEKTDKPVWVIIDRGIIEYFADDGRIYGAVEADANILTKELAVEAENGSVQCFRCSK